MVELSMNRLIHSAFRRDLTRFENALNGSRARNNLYSEEAQWVPQYVLEDVLRRCAQSHPSVALHFETEFVSFTQTFGGTGPTPCNQPTQVEAMVRLAHGKTLRAYFTAVQVPTDVCNPCTVMDALLHDAFLIEQIQNDFCAGSNCTIGVRQVSSVGSDEELSADGTTKYYRTLADVTESRNEVLKQSNLAFIAGGEVGVSTLRTMRHISRTIPGEERFPQSRARRDDRDRALLHGLSFV